MRLFLALELPRHVRHWLADGGRELRAELPRARWVRPELMHLTLVFLGDVDEARVSDLDREVGAAVASYPALDTQIRGFGSFPPGKRARVLWAGLETSGDLQGLRAAVATAVASVVAIDDRKTFHPHVTLARCQPTWPGWAVSKLVDAYSRQATPDPFRIDHISLIASELGRGPGGGPRYRTLSEYPLPGGSP